MTFRGLKTKDAKKKFLGAFVILAFVAYFANIATRYVVLSDANLLYFTVAAVAIIILLLAAIAFRKRKKIRRRIKRRRKKKSARKKRR
jgi:uncharacterized membrane protein YbhN (UPF0104 family)